MSLCRLPPKPNLFAYEIVDDNSRETRWQNSDTSYTSYPRQGYYPKSSGSIYQKKIGMSVNNKRLENVREIDKWQ